MKTLFPLILIASLLAACQEQPAAPAAPAVVETQPEDCNREAGYFWSELNKDCVQLFRDALKMKPDHPEARQHGKVFVVFNADSSRAEVWYPFERFTYIFEREGRKGSLRWVKDSLAVDCRGAACVYLEGEKVLYREQLQ